MLATHFVGATDTPVWFLFGATCALVGAACYALKQLGEVKADRHVQVFLEMGSRWESAQMSEALQKEKDYDPDELRDLYLRSLKSATSDDRAYAKEMVVLMRVPDYFEDAVEMAKAGGLDEKLFADNFGGLAVEEWKQWEPTLKTMQGVQDDLAYVGFERLAKRIEKEDQARRAGKGAPSAGRFSLRGFRLRGENVSRDGQ